MKITIKDFGPIKEFKYDLDPQIIVTYGDNNIGKSYSMQVVYLIIKYLTQLESSYNKFLPRSNFRSYNRMIVDTTAITSLVKDEVSSFASNNLPQREITEFIEKCLCKTLEESFLSSFMNACQNTFGNFEGICRNDPEITVESNGYSFVMLLNTTTIHGSFLTTKTYIKRVATNYYKSRNTNGKHFIYYNQNNNDETEVLLSKAVFSAWRQFRITITKDIGDVYFFPASRSGIYSGMSAFGAVIAELSRNRAFLTRKIELPGLSEPHSDYFLMLSSIKTKESNLYKSIVKNVEQDIIKGTVQFNRSRNALVYKPYGLEFEFEMGEVSSMVSELSPIVALLKYIISPPSINQNKTSNIVFIEEPEAHLHPENQIKLVDALLTLCNSGIKLIISSHSNYIFNKLNNLVLAKKLSYEAYSPILLERGNNGSKSRLLNIDDLGAIDENFVDVSERLYQERNEIISKMEIEE